MFLLFTFSFQHESHHHPQQLLHFQDFPYRESLILAMGDSMYLSMYLSVSDTLRISETSESEFWNILEHSTETVRLERFG